MEKRKRIHRAWQEDVERFLKRKPAETKDKVLCRQAHDGKRSPTLIPAAYAKTVFHVGEDQVCDDHGHVCMLTPEHRLHGHLVRGCSLYCQKKNVSIETKSGGVAGQYCPRAHGGCGQIIA